MAHVVFVSLGISGKLNAGFGLARQLAARGHRITFVSSLDVADQVETQGYAFVLLAQEQAIRQDPARLALEQLPARQRYRQRARLIRAGRRVRDFLLHNREFEETLDALAPDLVLVDEEMGEHAVRILAMEIPLLLVQTWPSTRRRAGIPPVDSTIIPGTMWSGLRTGLAWQRVLWTRRLIGALAPLYYAGTDRRSNLRALVADRGLDFAQVVDQSQGLPVTVTAAPLLYLVAAEFDFPSPEPNPHRYGGPMVALDRAEQPAAPGYRRFMDQWLQQDPAARGPLIYCSLGTYWQAHGPFLARLTAAVAGQPAWTLVISLGGNARPEQLGDLPPNVHIFTRVPQLEILAHADLMINHAGINSINESILLETPMLVYSTGHVDQNGTAARVAYHGLGALGHIARDDPHRIAYRIHTVLQDAAMRARVAEMGAVYARYAAGATAADHVEAVLQQDE